MTCNIEAFGYAIPLVPLVGRALLMIRFAPFLANSVPRKALDREGHRALLIAQISLSFVALYGLSAIPGNLAERSMPIWFALVGFLASLASLNIQGYKATRAHDQVADALFEMGSCAIVASVIVFVAAAPIPLLIRQAAIALAIMVWLVDYMFRIQIMFKFLEALEHVERRSRTD